MVLRSEILVNKNVLPTQEQALPGRETPMTLPETHFVNGNPLLGPFLDDVDDVFRDETALNLLKGLQIMQSKPSS